MIHIVQTQAANVVAIFGRDGGQQLLDRVDNIGDFGSEDGAIDQVCFHLLALVGVESNIAARINELTQMDSVVFVRNEANDVCCFGHFGRGKARQSILLGA